MADPIKLRTDDPFAIVQTTEKPEEVIPTSTSVEAPLITDDPFAQTEEQVQFAKQDKLAEEVNEEQGFGANWRRFKDDIARLKKSGDLLDTFMTVGKALPSSVTGGAQLVIGDENPDWMKQGSNQSLIGLGYMIASGGEQIHDLGDYKPNFLEGVAATAWGFLLDAPVFAATGGAGGFVGKKVGTSAAKRLISSKVTGEVVGTGGKRIVQSLMNSGVSKPLAERIARNGLTASAKRVHQQAAKRAAFHTTMGQSAGALSGYNMITSAMSDMAYNDAEFLRWDWAKMLKEGAIGATLGSMLGALSMGGRSIESLIKLPGVRGIASRAAVRGVTGVGEVGIFAFSDPILHQGEFRVPTWEEFVRAATMVLGAKISGGIQGHLPKGFTMDASPTKAQNKFSANDARMLSKHAEKITEFKVGEVSDAIAEVTKSYGLEKGDKRGLEDALVKIYANDQIPLMTKFKLMYESTGMYPVDLPKPVHMDAPKEKKDGVYTIDLYLETGEFLQGFDYINRKTFNEHSDLQAGVMFDNLNERMLLDMNGSQRSLIMAKMGERGWDDVEINSIRETNPLARTGKQQKMLSEFYQQVHDIVSTKDQIVLDKESGKTNADKKVDEVYSKPKTKKEKVLAEADKIEKIDFKPTGTGKGLFEYYHQAISQQEAYKGQEKLTISKEKEADVHIKQAEKDIKQAKKLIDKITIKDEKEIERRTKATAKYEAEKISFDAEKETYEREKAVFDEAEKIRVEEETKAVVPKEKTVEEILKEQPSEIVEGRAKMDAASDITKKLYTDMSVKLSKAMDKAIEVNTTAEYNKAKAVAKREGIEATEFLELYAHASEAKKVTAYEVGAGLDKLRETEKAERIANAKALQTAKVPLKTTPVSKISRDKIPADVRGVSLRFKGKMMVGKIHIGTLKESTVDKKKVYTVKEAKISGEYATKKDAVNAYLEEIRSIKPEIPAGKKETPVEVQPVQKYKSFTKKEPVPPVEAPEPKYRIGGKTYPDKESFIEALSKFNDPAQIPDPLYFDTKEIKYSEIDKLMTDAIEKGKEKYTPQQELEFTGLENLNDLVIERQKRIKWAEDAKKEMGGREAEFKMEAVKNLREAVKVIKDSEAYNKVERAAKKGKAMAKEERREITATMRQFLTERTKEINQLAGGQVIASMTKRVNGIREGAVGWRDVKRTMDYIENIINNEQVRRYERAKHTLMNKVGKLADSKTITEKTGGQGKRKAKASYKSEFSADYMTFLDKVKEAIGMSPQDIQKKLVDLEVRSQEENITSEQLETINSEKEALAYAGMEEMSLMDVAILHDNIKNSRENQRTVAAEERVERREVIRLRNEAMEKNLIPYGEDYKTLDQAPPDKKGQISGDASFKSLMDIIMSRRTITLEEKGIATLFTDPANREFTPRVYKASRGVQTDRQEVMESRDAAYEVILGTTSRGATQRKLIDLTKTVTSPVEISAVDNVTGKVGTRKVQMSQMQGIYLWLASQQRGGIETLFKEAEKGGMGWNEKSMEQLEAWLTPESKQIGEWMRDHLVTTHDGVNEVYRKENGVNLPRVENFFPFVRDAAQAEFLNTDVTTDKLFKQRAGSGHHIERVGSTIPFKYADAIEVFNKYIEEQIQYKNWAEPIRVLDETFGNPKIKAMIKQLHGTNVMNNIKWFQDRFNGTDTDSRIAALDGLTSMVTKGILFLNRSVGVKQTISTSMFLTAINPVQLTTGVNRMLFTPEGKELKKYMEAHPFLKFRGSAYWDVDQAPRSVRGLARSFKLSGELSGKTKRQIKLAKLETYVPKEQIDNFTSWTLRTGDKFPIINGGGAFMFVDMKRAGTSFKKLKVEAKKESSLTGQKYEKILGEKLEPFLTRWAAMSEFTQQSTELPNISRIRGSSSIYRAMSMFTSGAGQLNRVTMSSIRGITRSVKQGDNKAAVKYMRNLGIAHVLTGAMYTLIGNGFVWDDKKMIWGMALGNMRGVAMVGPALKVLSDKLVLDEPWADNATLSPLVHLVMGFADDLKEGQIAGRKWVETGHPYHKKKMYEAALRGVYKLGQLGGIQFKQAVDIYEDNRDIIIGESETPLRQFFGVEPYGGKEGYVDINELGTEPKTPSDYGYDLIGNYKPSDIDYDNK